MEPIEYHGASFLSAYLGVSLTSIHNWRSAESCGFPQPLGVITGLSGMRAAYGWTTRQLPEIRSWYAKRFDLDEDTAASRWKAIDENLAHPAPAKSEQCDGQLVISIPLQREGEAA